jgi:16S rRNA (uracil1498-N3)-methyltransferase
MAPMPGPVDEELALLVGPEGGFTPSENEMLRRLSFVTPISLGPFVLRADTAAAVGQALLLGMGWAEYVGST